MIPDNEVTHSTISNGNIAAVITMVVKRTKMIKNTEIIENSQRTVSRTRIAEKHSLSAFFRSHLRLL